MEIKLTLGRVNEIGMGFLSVWDKVKDTVTLSPKATYALIDLKRKIEPHFQSLQETIYTMAMNNGGEQQSNGTVRVPPENVETMNEKLHEIYEEEISVEYLPIKVRDNDVFPAHLMEILFDFLEME